MLILERISLRFLNCSFKCYKSLSIILYSISASKLAFCFPISLNSSKTFRNSSSYSKSYLLFIFSSSSGMKDLANFLVSFCVKFSIILSY